jgi:hypothetical protein
MKSIAVKKYLTGKRPPCAADGDGSIPHSYASNFALLYRLGPVSAPGCDRDYGETEANSSDDQDRYIWV